MIWRALCVGALLLAALPVAAGAWGGFTHQRISHRALESLAETNPIIAKVRDSAHLRSAFLGGSMAPDLAESFFRGKVDRPLKLLFHSPAFADKLIELSLDDPKAHAMALGWKAHIIQDAFAHGATGYANQKRTFTTPGFTGTGQNHGVAEAMLDILALAEEDPSRNPCIISPRRVAEACSQLGTPKSEEQIRELYLAFRSNVNKTESAFLAVTSRQRGRLLPSAQTFYADAEEGIVDGRGLKGAVEATKALLLDHVETLDGQIPFYGVTGIGLGNVFQNLKSVAVDKAGGGAWRSDTLVWIVENLGIVNRSFLIEFLRQLLANRETDYQAFLTTFETNGWPTD